MQRDFNMNWKVAAMHAPSKPIPAMMSINCSDPDSCPSSSLMLLLTDGDMPSRFTIFISEFLLEREGDPFDDLECLVTGVPRFGRL